MPEPILTDEPTESTTDEPVVESAPRVPPGSTLLEAMDGEGWKWRVQVIRAGVSLNHNEYPLDVLHRAAPLYNGVPVFPEHDAKTRGFSHKLGAITESAPNAHGIEATFEVMRSRPDVRDDMLQAWDIQQRTGRALFGFSHAATKFRTRPRRPAGRVVESIDAIESVDLVMQPSAGGAVLAPLSESQDSFVPDPLQEAIVGNEQLLARLRAGERLGPDDMTRLVESLGGAEVADAIEQAGKSTATATITVEADTSQAEASLDRINESVAAAERRFQLAECKATLADLLAESKLPQKFQDAIRHDFKERVFESSELEARIVRDKELFAEASQVRPHGLGSTVVVTEDRREKQQKAMDGLIWGQRQDGITPYLTLKEAFLDITGTHFSYIDPDLARRILMEARSYTGTDELLAESVTTSTFGDVLGDSIRRRMMQEYARPDRMTWRAIAPTFPVVDFRTFEINRWGGYGFLPLVNEGAPYQNLTTPGDEKATDSLDKYGGLEDLTLEMIANDDMNVVRRIPVKLGFAAVDTLYNAVWNTNIKDNATASYDSTALYHANHGNTGTAALDESGLSAVRVAMRNQTEYGNASGLPLGEANTPRIIAVPNELEIAAFKLTQSAVAITSNANATEPNFFNNRLQVIVVDSWTDANNWYAFADPSLMPALQVGFFQGREEPELFVQDAQNVGSMFTADKVTWKIRHIWVIVIVEHRATYRQVVT